MFIQREKLLGFLKSVEPGLSNKEIIEQMTNFIFTGKHLITYNDIICAALEMETDFKASVNAKRLVAVLSKIKSDQIELKTVQDKLRVISARTSLTLPSNLNDSPGSLVEMIKVAHDQIEYSEMGPKADNLPEGFMSGAFLCMFSASTNSTMPTLECIQAKGDEIFCSDNHRISHYKLPEPVKEDFLIHASTIDPLKQRLPRAYQVSKSWIHFFNDDGLIFSVRRVNGDYPDWSELLNKEIDGPSFELPEEMDNAIETVSVLFDKGQTSVKDRDMQVNVHDDEMILRVRTKAGSIKRTLDVNFEGEVEFQINTEFLKEAMKLGMNSITVGKNAAKMESENFTHLISLTGE